MCLIERLPLFMLKQLFETSKDFRIAIRPMMKSAMRTIDTLDCVTNWLWMACHQVGPRLNFAHEDVPYEPFKIFGQQRFWIVHNRSFRCLLWEVVHATHHGFCLSTAPDKQPYRKTQLTFTQNKVEMSKDAGGKYSFVKVCRQSPNLEDPPCFEKNEVGEYRNTADILNKYKEELTEEVLNFNADFLENYDTDQESWDYYDNDWLENDDRENYDRNLRQNESDDDNDNPVPDPDDVIVISDDEDQVIVVDA